MSEEGYPWLWDSQDVAAFGRVLVSIIHEYPYH